MHDLYNIKVVVIDRLQKSLNFYNKILIFVLVKYLNVKKS